MHLRKKDRKKMVTQRVPPGQANPEMHNRSGISEHLYLLLCFVIQGFALSFRDRGRGGDNF